MDFLQSFLLVPADSPKKMASARNLHPDALIYDLEDAVAPARKEEGRRLLADELKKPASVDIKTFVRVNGCQSRFLADDLEMVVRPEVSGVILPKCDDAREIAAVHQNIANLEAKNGLAENSTKLVLILETAKGVTRACELARASSRIIALFFGGEDYSADMGIVRTRAGDEIALARTLVALAARSEGLFAIDGPFTDFHDSAGLFEETRRIKQMGFTAKALIHPNQIDAVHLALAPNDEEIALAKEIVSVFESTASGVVVVRGKMVDEPVVAQARTILKQRARRR